MGSSVFHGGFSTFLAIVTLAPAKTYIFLVFFRLWFGIIIFGMANGFMLLPVILSFIGQTEDVMDPHAEGSDSDEESEVSDTNAKSELKDIKRFESEQNPLFDKKGEVEMKNIESKPFENVDDMPQKTPKDNDLL